MDNQRSLSRVALVGHSFVSGLEAFLGAEHSSNHPTVSASPGLASCDVTFFSVRGGSVFNNNTVELIARRLGRRRFDVVVIAMGDNDVVSHGNDIGLLAARIEAVAGLFRARAGAEAVYVGSVFPRFPRTDGRVCRYPYDPSYNRLAQLLNVELERSLSGQCVFWKHVFARFPDDSVQIQGSRNKFGRACVERDGVHLNGAGNFKFYKSLQALLIGHFRRV